MARFFSRNRSILKYLASLNKEKSFTERLTASNEVVQREEDNEEKKRDLGLFTKEEDIKIEDSATVTTLLSNVAASGVTSKDAIVNLPSSGLTAGDASIVFIDSNTAKYYISNGEGWYNATFANADPQWDSAPNSSYTLDSTNPLTIEPIAIDSGGKILSYTATLNSDASQFLTITKDSDNGRIFTLVGESAGAADPTNSGIVTFRASDGISFVTQNSTINLIYQSTGTLVSSAASVNEGSSVTFTLPTTGYSDGTTFPYTITGIQSADISQSLSGNMTVSSNNATVSITAVADTTTEGSQTMTFSADGQSVNVTINDTSTTPQPTAKATGGSISIDGNYIVHTFTSNGTFNPSQALSCSYIAVGGGGHGGGYRGGSYSLGSGGGGAGGYKQGALTISSSMPITIGAGGTYTSGTSPTNGGNTTVGGQLNITATGGGSGGSVTIWNGSGPGNSGGSGGGGAGSYSSNGGRGSGSSGEGNDGGIGYSFSNNSYSGGGGGGAASAGGNNSGRNGGNGGNGIASNISGSYVTYAAGGGGGSLIEQNPPNPVSGAESYRGQGGTSALGGVGGGEGGVAQYNSFGGALGYSQHGTDGQTPGSGGGGSGRLTSSDQTSLPGDGADGIVIIRYLGV